MSKKKILIVNKSLKIGGVQRALINMINELSGRYDIHLFLFYPEGEFKDLLPNNVKVINSSILLKSIGMTLDQALKSKNIIVILYRIFGAIWSKLFTNWLPIKIAIVTQKKLSGFDLAISYIQDSNRKSLYSGCNKFVLESVNAKQKLAWIHGDYELSGLNTDINNKMYKKFDKVISVSEGCQNTLLKVIPELEIKSEYAYNMYNIDEIIELSKEEDPFEVQNDRTRIVTVARLGWEKGFLRAINIIKRLADSKYKFKWYIIGDGIFKTQMLELIKKNNLEDYIELLGHKINPYPYIRYADLFFLPSFHEAAPMTIGEAKICGTPVIAADYVSAKEQIIEGLEGFIAPNTEEGIYLTLKDVFDHEEKLYKCKEYLKETHYNNQISIEQHIKIFEE